jgi:hypothetical protein
MQRARLAVAALALAAVAALALAAAACQPQGRRPAPPASPGGPAACAFWDGLDGGLARWMVAWRKLLPRLDCSAFEAAGRRSASPAPLPPADRSAALAAAPARWRTRDGARVALVTDDRGSPDSAVDVIDTESGAALRLLSCGTACRTTDAAWLADGRLVVAGWSEWHPAGGPPRCVEGAPCTFVALLTVIDVDAGSALELRGPEVDEAAFRAWLASP